MIGGSFILEWLNETVAIGSLIVTIISLTVSIFAVVLVIRFRRELSLSEQVANVPELLYREYIYRKLPSPIIIDGKELSTLKEARNAVRQQIKRGKTPEEIFYGKNSGLQNEFSYQVSVGLQHIGLLILMGAIPIKLVLLDIGLLIVEDWKYCSKLVKEELRENAPRLKTNKKLSEPIYFQRRHAEWLVHAAALYLHNYWEGEKVNELFSLLGDARTMQKREKELRKSEPGLVSDKTSKEIEKFLYNAN